MSQQLINRSPDLKRLQDEGYEIEVKSAHLLVHNVPYVDAQKQVRKRVLVSVLDLAGDVTIRPGTHVVMFAGNHPCDREGRQLEKIKNGSTRQILFDAFGIDHTFSSKPKDGYPDYYEKMATYAAIISGPAEFLDPSVSPKSYRVVESAGGESVFRYEDTASSSAGITAISRKLELEKVAIVGLGGTGSYLLDFLAKTPVQEIHLFDGDDLLQKNAFRMPGAVSAEDLKAVQKKVEYFANQYAPLRKNIFAHPIYIEADNVDQLEEMDFVFICMDRGDAKVPIFEKLVSADISFIDVGMGILLVDEMLQGIVRVTTSTSEKRDHILENNRVGFSSADNEGPYSQNIQIADLNALNAVLAIIKWKKLCGYYRDMDGEFSCTYTLDGNLLINEDKLKNEYFP